MKKLIGTLSIVIGLLILFFRTSGTGGCLGGNDYSLEIVGNSLIFLLLGIFLVRKKSNKI